MTYVSRRWKINVKFCFDEQSKEIPSQDLQLHIRRMRHDIVNSLRPSDAYMPQNSHHNWLAWSAPSHDLNQCWDIINWVLRNKLQWKFHRNSYIAIQGNAFENVVSIIAFIPSRPQRGRVIVRFQHETLIHAFISNSTEHLETFQCRYMSVMASKSTTTRRLV